MYAIFIIAIQLWFSAPPDLIVAADGSGQFRSIQAAIEHLSDATDDRQRVIFIKKGIYREKVFLEKSHITLRGAHEQKVQIIISEAREMWRCEHTDDWGAAAINIRASDIHLENLTVLNEYGFKAKGDSTIICRDKQITVRPDGHQFALRAMPPTTRLIVKNCTFRALGGDTVSPWNVESGQYFFKNCTMEGSVDFYCPRGWAYAENCHFICHNLNAAIWHDGTGNESAKTVLKNCSFEGDANYALGRYHRDAQFFLIGCRFSEAMADKAIYKVKKDTTLQWPERIFYYQCRRMGGSDFNWHNNNISDSLARQIDVAWTFDGKWNPKQ